MRGRGGEGRRGGREERGSVNVYHASPLVGPDGCR